MSAPFLKPWKPGPGEWNLGAAQHLLQRAGFGAGPREAEELVAQGFPGALNSVLDQDAHDPRLVQGAKQILASGQIERAGAWWMSLILGSGAPLRERIALMWHDHFATSMTKVQDHRMMHNQVQLFRSQGPGDFRMLLHAVAKDPAMLRWLDGDQNRAGHPNENFAREVMELFALGVGHYGEHDVQEAARAFTGWRESGSRFVWRKADHDGGPKTILGRSGAWGSTEALDIILDSPHCPRHVARRLLTAFVHPDPQEPWVQATAQLLLEKSWHIEDTLRVLLASNLFFSASSRRARIASPVELMASAIRGLGLRVSPTRALGWCAQMGQNLYHPRSVKGWVGMRRWINAGTWIARHNALIELCESQAKHITGTPRELLGQLLPALLDSPFEGRLLETLAGHPRLGKNPAQVAGLILTSPEFHLT